MTISAAEGIKIQLTKPEIWARILHSFYENPIPEDEINTHDYGSVTPPYINLQFLPSDEKLDNGTNVGNCVTIADTGGYLKSDTIALDARNIQIMIRHKNYNQAVQWANGIHNYLSGNCFKVFKTVQRALNPLFPNLTIPVIVDDIEYDNIEYLSGPHWLPLENDSKRYLVTYNYTCHITPSASGTANRIT